MILKLSGSAKDPFVVISGIVKNEDDLLCLAISTGKANLVREIYFNRLFLSFWFKRYKEAAEMAERCRGPQTMYFVDLYHAFYEGLTAFHFARNSFDETKWMGIGENVVLKFRKWANHSTWNFENKLLLLEAEFLHSKGEKESAQIKYEASINSARKHHFLHEEGLAMDLFGAFHSENGNADEAMKQIRSARACFEKWGALGIVGLLKQQPKK